MDTQKVMLPFPLRMEKKLLSFAMFLKNLSAYIQKKVNFKSKRIVLTFNLAPLAEIWLKHLNQETPSRKANNTKKTRLEIFIQIYLNLF